MSVSRSISRPLSYPLTHSISVFRGALAPLPALIKSLFSAGEQGAFYVPRPIVNGAQALFQDSAGTVPVTADGDPVGRMLDQSGRGNHATQSVSANRLIYRTDGTLHRLDGDGFLEAPNNIITGIPVITAVHAGFGEDTTSNGWVHMEGSAGGADAFQHTFEPGLRTGGGAAVFGAPIDNTPVVFSIRTGADGLISNVVVNVDSVARARTFLADAAMDLGATTNTDLFKGIFTSTYGAMFIDKRLTNEELQDVENYLASLVGVTL